MLGCSLTFRGLGLIFAMGKSSSYLHFICIFDDCGMWGKKSQVPDGFCQLVFIHFSEKLVNIQKAGLFQIVGDEGKCCEHGDNSIEKY